GSYLPHDNGARVNFFTAIYFDAASLRVGVSSVAGASLTFFMCHDVLRLYQNLLYFHAGQFLTMAGLFPESLAALHFADNQFGTFCLGYNLADHFCAFHK